MSRVRQMPIVHEIDITYYYTTEAFPHPSHAALSCYKVIWPIRAPLFPRIPSSFQGQLNSVCATASRQMLIEFVLQELTCDDGRASNLAQADESSSSEGEIDARGFCCRHNDIGDANWEAVRESLGKTEQLAWKSRSRCFCERPEARIQLLGTVHR